MRRIVRSPLFLLCLPLVICLVGCAEQAAQAPTAPTAVLSSVSAASAGGLSSMTAAAKPTKPAVPFRAAVTGELTLVPGSPKCPQGPYALGSINATGNALHMGNTDLRTEQCVNVVTGVIDGKVLVLTAANGDELYGTFAGQSEAPGNVGDQFHVTATFVLKGGTGRFENATGTGEMAAVLTHAASFPYPGRWEWTGTIRY